ncbi:curli production assembly protein CsgG [Aerophototrophica crusticola]|uniref:Curli production assembly protein CsgG n=1 Tax=Aerophototrophica crusticola TaxID=1709002 RepID=A0A858R9T4_9PROT|nr:curli production assembly protein CsgG [Rhodospirillaceae bacterium B3]
MSFPARPAPVLTTRSTALSLAALLLLGACATPPAKPPAAVQAPAEVAKAQAALQAAPPAVKALKRKIAIGRFTNETRYGKALLTADQIDPLGRQTGDMLSARLVESGRFLVLERPDLAAIKAEQALAGGPANIVGTDTLIVGSLTEFGRSTEGQSGFLSNTKRQIARAKVEIRLVDVRTGLVFFSAAGTGEAALEKGTVMGFGSQAEYDQTLNDRAIGAAISDVLNSLITKIEERPWRSDILKAEPGRVFISGGARQGLKPGDRLAVMKAGEKVRSGQSGFDIELPPTQVAELVVDSLFGDSETNEGSVARVVSGTVPANTAGLFVAEVK